MNINPLPNDIRLSKNDFNILIVESFRYALLREYTGATIDCAERIKFYWNDIQKCFQEQIKRDVENAIETKQLKEIDSIKAWEEVLKLKTDLDDKFSSFEKKLNQDIDVYKRLKDK